MNVYIAGPITGMPNENRKAFAKAEKHIMALGHKPINPIRVCRMLPKGSAWEAYMKKCIAALVKCDAIALLNGWDSSPGAKLENTIAEQLGFVRFDIVGTI